MLVELTVPNQEQLLNGALFKVLPQGRCLALGAIIICHLAARYIVWQFFGCCCDLKRVNRKSAAML